MSRHVRSRRAKASANDDKSGYSAVVDVAGRMPAAAGAASASPQTGGGQPNQDKGQERDASSRSQRSRFLTAFSEKEVDAVLARNQADAERIYYQLVVIVSRGQAKSPEDFESWRSIALGRIAQFKVLDSRELNVALQMMACAEIIEKANELILTDPDPLVRADAEKRMIQFSKLHISLVSAYGKLKEVRKKYIGDDADQLFLQILTRMSEEQLVEGKIIRLKRMTIAQNLGINETEVTDEQLKEYDVGVCEGNTKKDKGPEFDHGFRDGAHLADQIEEMLRKSDVRMDRYIEGLQKKLSEIDLSKYASTRKRS